MRKVMLVAALAVLVVPAAAVAAKPPHPSHPSTSTNAATPTVSYILSGTINAYTAANGATNGSVQITVSGSNLHAKTLKGQQLTFAVSSQTKVVLHHGAAIVGGDHGIVKVRGLKNLTAGAAQAPIAQQMIDQGKRK